MPENFKYEIKFKNETCKVIKLEEDNFGFDDCVPFVNYLTVTKGNESLYFEPKEGEVELSDDWEWYDDDNLTFELITSIRLNLAKNKDSERVNNFLKLALNGGHIIPDIRLKGRYGVIGEEDWEILASYKGYLNKLKD
tara:strand:+ start:58 stop:471 length:414 start_codon:yes stop_codon:yes gene_type:complete